MPLRGAGWWFWLPTHSQTMAPCGCPARAGSRISPPRRADPGHPGLFSWAGCCLVTAGGGLPTSGSSWAWAGLCQPRTGVSSRGKQRSTALTRPLSRGDPLQPLPPRWLSKTLPAPTRHGRSQNSHPCLGPGDRGARQAACCEVARAGGLEIS